CEREDHHALQIVGRIVVLEVPRVGQRFLRLDGEDLAVQYAAPVSAKIETVTHGWLEVILHQPLLDQMWLGEGAPDLFRWMGDLTFDDDGERFGGDFVHWSILLSKPSSWSNRPCQKPAILLVQSSNGARALSCALWRVARPSCRSRPSPARLRTARCFETAGCEPPARAVRAPTV